MKVALYSLLVLRGMHTHIPVTVPRHEADLLRAVHGADGVELLAPEPVGSMAVAAVYEERERLRMKYGMKNADTAWVDAVYPSDTALAQALDEGAVAEGGGAGEPETPATKPRSKKAADAPAV